MKLPGTHRRPVLTDAQRETVAQIMGKRLELLRQLAKLPSQRQLAEDYGVSRCVIRSAQLRTKYQRKNILDERVSA